MAAADLPSLDIFECSVCLDSMLDKRPVALSCLHTFCTPCVRRLYQRPPLTCPTCRRETVVPDGDVENLPVNRDLIKMMEREKEITRAPENLCDTCLRKGMQKPSAGMCFQCVRKLCNKCIEHHKKLAVFNDHQIVKKDENVDGEDNKYCKIHTEPLDFVCMQCVEALCVDCISNEHHTDHEANIEKFNNGIAILRKQYEQQSTKIDNYLKDLNDIKNDIDTDSSILITSKNDLVELQGIFQKKVEEIENLLKPVNINYTLMKKSDENVIKLINQALVKKNQLRILEKDSDIAFIAHHMAQVVDDSFILDAAEVRVQTQEYSVLKFEVTECAANENVYVKPVGILKQLPPSDKQVKAATTRRVKREIKAYEHEYERIIHVCFECKRENDNPFQLFSAPCKTCGAQLCYRLRCLRQHNLTH